MSWLLDLIFGAKCKNGTRGCGGRCVRCFREIIADQKRRP